MGGGELVLEGNVIRIATSNLFENLKAFDACLFLLGDSLLLVDNSVTAKVKRRSNT